MDQRDEEVEDVPSGAAGGDRGDSRASSRRNHQDHRRFWPGQKVRHGDATGVVVQVTYHAVKVWMPTMGVCDYLRPTPTSLAPPGASTVDDLRPLDSAASIADKLLRLTDIVEAFSVSKEEIAVKTGPESIQIFKILGYDSKSLAKALDMAIQAARG